MATVRAIALAAVLVGGCAFEPQGPGTAADDAAPADAAFADGPLDSAVATDGAPPDGAPPDGAPPDAPPPDAPPPDAPPPDAPPPDAPPPCPVGYDLVVGASRYRIDTDVRGLGTAVDDCSNDGSRTHLATLENAADLGLVLAGRIPGEQFWVGATCSASSMVDCSSDAAWSWQPGGAPVTPSLWGPSEPNNGQTERSAVAFRTPGPNGTWRLNNVTSAELHAYVCECGD